MRFLIALTVLVLLVATNTTMAQTPDGEVPVNEGVCDDLMFGATKGLYGLCVAFCEAQDCEPDFSLEDPFENCKASAPKILENYNKRKSAGDPDMPCIQQSSCPCWTSNELAGLRFPETGDTSACQSITVFGSDVDFWNARPGGTTQALVYTQNRPGDPTNQSCLFRDVCSDGLCLNVTRNQTITESEYVNCTAELIASGQERGFDCWD